jgi:3-dehydroquinate dehydratase type I
MNTEKTVTVRNLTIGKGMPKICVPLVGNTVTELVKEAEYVKTLPIDMVEWRLDFFEQVEENEAVVATLGRLRQILQDTPILCTFRTKGEGGARDITADGYYDLYEAVAKSGQCDMIDIELFAGDTLPSADSYDYPQEDFFEKMLSMIHRYGAKVIASNHDFQKTPAAQEMIYRLCKMQGLGADIAKIAVMPEQQSDVDVLLNATIHMVREYAAIPIVTMSMGEMGSISRLNGQLTGSAITFGSASAASAPGQIPVAELKKALEMIHANEFILKQQDMKTNIYLIGFMGTGKSSVSATLKEQLGYEEIDTDALIVQEQGMAISDIFEQYGEPYFRQLETECLIKLQETKGKIISCGGGMAVKPENVELMKQNGKVVLLTATPETILERVKHDDSRPLLRNRKTVEGIAELMEKRREAYENAADKIVPTDNKSVKDIATEIVQLCL